jgi:hypothetical protein
LDPELYLTYLKVGLAEGDIEGALGNDGTWEGMNVNAGVEEGLELEGEKEGGDVVGKVGLPVGTEVGLAVGDVVLVAISTVSSANSRSTRILVSRKRSSISFLRCLAFWWAGLVLSRLSSSTSNVVAGRL